MSLYLHGSRAIRSNTFLSARLEGMFLAQTQAWSTSLKKGHFTPQRYDLSHPLSLLLQSLNPCGNLRLTTKQEALAHRVGGVMGALRYIDRSAST